MTVPPAHPPIPYGMSDFSTIRREGYLYVDKTRFIRTLEQHRYAFLIRPRRFGKSLWLSVLEHYYDRRFREQFDELFGGTEIAAAPTPERNSHVVLRFDFSALDQALATLPERFEEYCEQCIGDALDRNADMFPPLVREGILGRPGTNAKLGALFAFAAESDIHIYVLIDEYDNFANNVLAHHGDAAYEDFTHGEGFYRSFFAALKAGTGSGGLGRLFMTGVSPITLDDVTSGFNIGTNISLSARFHDVLGFTEDEVSRLLMMYHENSALEGDVSETLDVMREWYDGYRFCVDALATLFNTDMVLYYLQEAVLEGRPPRQLIDDNVRIDYGKLRHLLVVNQRLNGNFDMLGQLASDEEMSLNLRSTFPLAVLEQPDSFGSLLHYFGLVSIRGEQGMQTVVGIPNQTVRQLLYGYLRDGLRDVGAFSVNLHRLTGLGQDMVLRGDWRPFFESLRDAIAEQTGIRDYISGEKVIQGFLAAYLSATESFLLRSEAELGKGYADLLLEPLPDRQGGLRHGYVIELRYLKRGTTGDGEALQELVANLVEQAKTQLTRYLADSKLGLGKDRVRFTGIALVFHGWELVASESVAPGN